MDDFPGALLEQPEVVAGLIGTSPAKAGAALIIHTYPPKNDYGAGDCDADAVGGQSWLLMSHYSDWCNRSLVAVDY